MARNAQYQKLKEKIPTLKEMNKYKCMPDDMLATIMFVEPETVFMYRLELKAELKAGKPCNTCGLLFDDSSGKHFSFCSDLYKKLGRLPYIDARYKLESLASKNSIVELSSKLDIDDSALSSQLKRLVINAKKSERTLELTIDINMVCYALSFFSLSQVANLVNMSRMTLHNRVKEAGFSSPSSSAKKTNRKRYKERYGKNPSLRKILFDDDIKPMMINNKTNCLRCEMEIYLDPDLANLGLGVCTEREKPTLINYWSQQAFEFEHDESGDWTLIKATLIKAIRKGKKPIWQYWDKGSREWRDEGCYCRFCLADMRGEPSPTPPAWILANSDNSRDDGNGNGEKDMIYG